jgi:small-conductance mechanosensitive channel
MPEGEIRLDFSRPGGQAELSIWAIRRSVLQKIYGTAAVGIAAVILTLLGRLSARIKPSDKNRGAFILGYVVLALVLIVIGGFMGLVIWLVIVLVTELLRRSLARRVTAKA